MVKKDEGKSASNERLEFLGDAILAAVISEYLYHQYPSKKEGDLTKMRTKLVNGFFLNELALKLNIDKVLEAGIGEKESPKSIYGNALEALIGAVYIDKGHKVARQFVLHQLMQIENRKDELMNAQIDHKSKLIEWTQKKKVDVRFEVTEINVEVKKYRAVLYVAGKLESSGLGFTKKEAEQQAAKIFFETTPMV